MSIIVSGFFNKNKKKGLVEFDEVVYKLFNKKKDKFIEELNNLIESNRNIVKKISKLKYKTIKNLCYSSINIPEKLKICKRDLDTMESIFKDDELIDYLAKNPLHEKNEKPKYSLSQDVHRSSPYNKKQEEGFLFSTPNDNSIKYPYSINQINTVSYHNFYEELGGIDSNLASASKFERSNYPEHLNESLINGNEDFLLTDKRKKLPSSVINHPKFSFSPKTENKDIKMPNRELFYSAKKLEIKNPIIKRLVNECNEYGPYCKGCHTCKRRNLQFYQKMNTDSAVLLLNFIKKQREDYFTLSNKKTLF